MKIVRRGGYLVRAALGAALLGIIETFTSERGRRLLALVVLAGLAAIIIASNPFRTVAPGEVAIRIDRLTGGVTRIPPGWTVVLPGLHELRKQPAGDRIYRPEKGARADASAPYQSIEGLSIGVEITVRYAIDLDNERLLARGLPDDIGEQIVEPVIDAVLHRRLAQHTVREIFSTQRAPIEKEIEAELGPLLAPDGVILRSVFLGTVDLPKEYRAGLESLLTEELQSEKMRYTLELKEKQVKESELVADAEKVRREKAAEAAAQEELIAARARGEAMKHILPFKEKEIEQKRLEAEASRVTRLKLAETEAEARRIEAAGEAEYRAKLADAEAYRLQVTGKAQSDQLERDAALISKNPLLIQKTFADKLSDKISVIIAPPGSGGFFGQNLLGPQPAEAPAVESE